MSRSSSIGTSPDSNSEQQQELLMPKGGRSLSAQVSPCDGDLLVPDRHPLFQRSISEITGNSPENTIREENGIGPMSKEQGDNDNRNKMGSSGPGAVVRRRNNSGGMGG